MKKIVVLLTSCMVLAFFFFIGFDAKAASYVENGVNIGSDYGYNRYTSSKGYYSSVNGKPVYLVTDAGKTASNQPEYIVDLTDFGLSTQALYHGAYKTIVVIFQITMKEINDGYQEIYITNPSSTANENMVTPITTFQHGPGYVNSNYSRYEFYAEISGAAFGSSQFAIGFSAHGVGSDDWIVGNLAVQICTSTEARKITSLRYVENANVDSLWA